tara:strand:+ start:288 stop:575 length:288 start_codon:yes stop_codon:yes gene_type:complete
MGERKVGEYKIDKNVPIPKGEDKPPRNPLHQLFLEMEEGDSVLLDHESEAQIIRNWLYQRDVKKKKKGEREIWNITCRTQEDGCRVWKVKRKLDE